MGKPKAPTPVAPPKEAAAQTQVSAFDQASQTTALKKKKKFKVSDTLSTFDVIDSDPSKLG